ncbi:MAG: hypothetical protein AAGC55_34530, partial [Myxococcota bacterium]
VNKSRQVQNNSSNGDFVISSAAAHGATIVEQLLLLNRDVPEERKMSRPALDGMIHWLAAVLEAKNRAMDGAELRYLAEQADDPDIRARRDRAAEHAMVALKRVQSHIATHLGEAGLTRYGLAGNRPRRPGELAEYIGAAITLLRQYPQTASDSLAGTFDSEQVARTLDDVLAPLRAGIADVIRERRELEARLIERNRALDEWNKAYRGVASSLTGLYTLAGADELAQRIRPTSRRAAGRDTPPSSMDNASADEREAAGPEGESIADRVDQPDSDDPVSAAEGIAGAGEADGEAAGGVGGDDQPAVATATAALGASAAIAPID